MLLSNLYLFCTLQQIFGFIIIPYYCNNLAEVVSPTAGQSEVVSPTTVQFMGKKIVV